MDNIMRGCDEKSQLFHVYILNGKFVMVVQPQ